MLLNQYINWALLEQSQAESALKEEYNKAIKYQKRQYEIERGALSP